MLSKSFHWGVGGTGRQPFYNSSILIIHVHIGQSGLGWSRKTHIGSKYFPFRHRFLGWLSVTAIHHKCDVMFNKLQKRLMSAAGKPSAHSNRWHLLDRTFRGRKNHKSAIVDCSTTLAEENLELCEWIFGS